MEVLQGIIGFLPRLFLVLLIIAIVFIVFSLFSPVKYELKGTAYNSKLKGFFSVRMYLGILIVEGFIKKQETAFYRIRIKLFGKTVLRRGKDLDLSGEKSQGANQDKSAGGKDKKSRFKKDSSSNVKRIHASEDTSFKKIKDEDKKIDFKYFINMPDKDVFFKAVLRFIKSVLIETMPNNFYARVVLGTGDPCSTGQTIGVIYALSGYFGQDVEVTPDFERKVIEGNFKASGGFLPFKLVVIALKFMFCKPVWRTIKLYMKGRE